MTVTKWEPFAIEMPERWKNFFHLDTDMQGWIRVEELHEDDALVVRAEMPGVDPDKDIDVSVSDGVLHIGAERKASEEHKDEKSYRSEFHYGSFSRNLRLPRGVDSKSVKARYADGILEVRIPWPESKSNGSEKVAVSRD